MLKCCGKSNGNASFPVKLWSIALGLISNFLRVMNADNELHLIIQCFGLTCYKRDGMLLILCWQWTHEDI